MASSPACHLRRPPRLRLLLPLSTSAPYPWLSAWSHPRQRSRLPRAAALRARPPPGAPPSSDSDDSDAIGTSRASGRSTMALILSRLRRAGYSPPRTPAPPPPRTRTTRRGGRSRTCSTPTTACSPTRAAGSTPPTRRSARSGTLASRGAPHAAAARGRGAAGHALAGVDGGVDAPAAELRRLRHAAIRIKSRTKVGGAGVTREIVEKIKEKWKTEEVVRVKVSSTPALNMRLFHEILESLSMKSPIKGSPNPSLLPTEKVNSVQDSNGPLVSNAGKEEIVVQAPEIKYEDEIDKLLDELGPRYTDWPGSDPLPVDADLLPATVPGYKPLSEFCHLVSGHLLAEWTLPIYAVLPGTASSLCSCRQLQGLANAMVKLWEKSSIAKVALKRGVQLTTSERMAEDIKKLTGGVMLSRNNEFIVFYRGKDFLSSELAEVLLERERLAKSFQDEEEARRKAASYFSSSAETYVQPTVAGTLGETLEANSKYGTKLDENHEDKMARTVEAARHADLVRKLEWKLSLAQKKMEKAERVLGKVETALRPTEDSDLKQ
ncbi:unnamed protein product [Miscanthus lutarioriparius]|uniref:CRM domain-containing protein n=1 Tax=Miscanthus lutarioriparius TaxID=422564 RepID=A0A811PZ57_9POAL|nr:unnamed protein product [Miscanthus lutarioriparius]